MTMTRSRHVARSQRCHSCVDGLRARLKPGRFWFDSRGWHALLPAKPRGVALLFQRSNSPASITRRARATSFDAHKLGWFNSNCRRHEDHARRSASSVFSGRRCSTVGHLNMDQANNRQQHSSRSRDIRCVSTSKLVRLQPSPPVRLRS